METHQPALADVKRRLRREITSRRAALAANDVERLSTTLADHFFASHLPPPKGSLIMGYLSFRNEVKAETILLKAQSAGYRVVLPYADLERRVLVPYIVTDLNRQISLSRYGMREPDPVLCQPASLSEIALVLVPGVAFDERGYRLGYGGGFYDRFIAAFGEKSLPVPTLVGLAFEFQIVNRVPAERHDMPLDYVLTEARLIATAARPQPRRPTAP